jgi:hypothetical protein
LHVNVFVQANKAALKSIAQSNRERAEAADARARQAPFKMSRFANIGSTIAQERDKPMSQQSSAQPNRAFLRKNQGTSVVKRGTSSSQMHSRSGESKEQFEYEGFDEPSSYYQPNNQSASEPSTRPMSHSEYGTSPTNSFTPRARSPHSTTNAASSQSPVNFVAANARSVINAMPVRPSSDQSRSQSKHSDFGRVPAYIHARRAEAAAAEEAKREAALRATIPAGMRLISEDERQQTLTKLRESAAAVEAEISRLPLRIETISRRKQKDDLVSKLTDIESAIELFSKPKVYLSL